MILCNLFILTQASDAISILTPLILLFWFYYSHKQTLSNNYFKEVDGIYAGFTEPTVQAMNDGGVNAGIIMNIREIDGKGFFKGTFDYGENETIITTSNRIIHDMLRDGIHTFYGKMNFTLYRDKNRHPFKKAQNRRYRGVMYVVDRLDVNFEAYDIEPYLSAEYEIVHYREMQTMIFNLKKNYKPTAPSMPQKFILYKKMGVTFEPYINVKDSVFRGDTRADT